MMKLSRPAYMFVQLDHIVRVIGAPCHDHDTLVEAVDCGGQTIFCYISTHDAHRIERDEAAARADAAQDCQQQRDEIARSPWPPR